MIAAVAAQLRSQASVEQFAEPSSKPPSPLNALLKAQPAG